VSKDILMEFVGFESQRMAREYTFMLRETSGELREFTLTITHEAFSQGRIRFQDAPDVCSLKLRRELATHENHPPQSHFQITDAELEDYRSAHSHRQTPSPFGHKPSEGD
jgi:hypothetical protein